MLNCISYYDKGPKMQPKKKKNLQLPIKMSNPPKHAYGAQKSQL